MSALLDKLRGHIAAAKAHEAANKNKKKRVKVLGTIGRGKLGFLVDDLDTQYVVKFDDDPIEKFFFKRSNEVQFL